MSAASGGRTVAAILLFGVAVTGILWMPGEFLSGDPNAWREETRSLLLGGELHVPAEFARQYGEPGQYFVRNERNGLYYSKYGIGNAILALPPLWLERETRGLTPPGHKTSLLLFNLWHVAYGIVLAALLYALSADYSRRPGVRALYVSAAIYCTSLWFYQRAQSAEVYQVILFTAFFMALVRFLRPLQRNGPRGLDARAWGWLAAAWICAAALVSTRVIYGLLLPITLLLSAWCAVQGRPWRELRAPAFGAALLLPPLLIVSLLAAVNQVKFGAPWLTGYHQWLVEIHWPVGPLLDGLMGYLVSPRFSIFLCFPLLLFALVGARRFAEQHRLAAIAALSIFVPFLLLLAKLPSWAGEWSYGPRYLLPMLPVLSLPFLVFADQVLDRIRTWRARAWAAAAVAVLAYSGYLQVQVARAPFWIYYEARAALGVARSPESIGYFFNHHPALIADDLIRHRRDFDALPFFAEMKRSDPPFAEEYRRVIGGMLERGNLYWSLPPAGRR